MKKVLNCFGPADVVSRLQAKKWSACFPDGENFHGIGLAGYCLCRPADNLCPLPITIVVRKKDTGESFLIGGFCFPLF